MRLENGRAIVTLKLKEDAVPVYRDASVLLRPKTGLKDMVAELTPGTRAAGELPPGERIPIGADRAGREPRRDPRRRSTTTRAPTCSCCCPRAASALGGNGA